MTTIGTRTVSVYPFRKVAGETQFLTLRRAPHLELAGTGQAVHGRMEPGETAVEAARRELREETGLAPARFYVANHVEVLYDPRQDQVVMVPVFAAEIPAEATVTVSSEHTAAECCSVREALRRFIWPTQQQAVGRIVEDIAEAARPNPLLEI